MSFARPSSPSGFHPDTIRIVAMSAAIALNAAALLAVMRPMVAEMSFAPLASQAIRLIDHPEPRPVAPPPPIDLKPLPVKATPTTLKPTPVAPRVAAPTDEGTAPMVAAPTVVDAAPTAPPAVPSAPVEATLAYVAAPAPAYPKSAISRRLQGTVTLRVLVDETGKPVDVVIESSSGHDQLDQAARDQVLAKWRFQPASVNGQKVRAWARIPITFDLRSI